MTRGEEDVVLPTPSAGHGPWAAASPRMRWGHGGRRRRQPPREPAGRCWEMERKRDGHSLSGTIVFMADDRFTDTGAVRGRTGPKHAAPPQKYKIIYRNNGGVEKPPPLPSRKWGSPGRAPAGHPGTAPCLS